VYTGSQSTSSLPRRLKLAVEKTNSNTTSSASNSVKHNSGTKVPTAAKPRTAGKIESDGKAMLEEKAGRIEAGGKYDEEMEVSGGGQKKFSFVGLISEDMR
jgi:hypothetical protein